MNKSHSSIWIALVAFSTAPLLATLTLAQDAETVPSKTAQDFLRALIPAREKFVTVDSYVAGANVKDTKVGSSCSSSSNGKITGTVDDNGNVEAGTTTNGTTNCRDIHVIKHTMFLGFEDAADPNAAYMVTVQCVEKMVWDHCDTPPEHTIYPVVLEEGKHGTFEISAATSQKLGGKMKVAKFAVIEVSHVTKKPSN